MRTIIVTLMLLFSLFPASVLAYEEPIDTGNYNATAQTVQTNVVAEPLKTPAITWSKPVDIIYGTTLNSTQLNAVATEPVTNAPVAGTFTYAPVSETVLNTGTQILQVVFTPADTAKYSTVTQTVEINVLKATPVINWNNPADIVYKTPLGNTQLDAVAANPATNAPVEGTFAYTPADGTVLKTGTQILQVMFTPTDTENYSTAIKAVQINVVAAPLKIPAISWNKPADIIYGTALNSAQLNAVAADPVTNAPAAGTFTYTPVSGTVLNTGTQTLQVVFTPVDTATYSTATQAVQINVVASSIDSLSTEPSPIVSASTGSSSTSPSSTGYVSTDSSSTESSSISSSPNEPASTSPSSTESLPAESSSTSPSSIESSPIVSSPTDSPSTSSPRTGFVSTSSSPTESSSTSPSPTESSPAESFPISFVSTSSSATVSSSTDSLSTSSSATESSSTSSSRAGFVSTESSTTEPSTTESSPTESSSADSSLTGSSPTESSLYDPSLVRYDPLTGEVQEIPEFPSVAVPVVAILGLLFISQRRKGN
ncbi:PEF-CTERM sorting domain-containing protein [Methanosarcina sp. MSH10X1]|nr:PEF-CTERM sorting domain-containing protein [Methanosarcina sp. MSH10X1]